jgi:hypothetical protein
MKIEKIDTNEWAIHVGIGEIMLLISALQLEIEHHRDECPHLEKCERQAEESDGGSLHARTIRIYRTIGRAIGLL